MLTAQSFKKQLILLDDISVDFVCQHVHFNMFLESFACMKYFSFQH